MANNRSMLNDAALRTEGALSPATVPLCETSNPEVRTLRIGALVDSGAQPRWVIQVLKEVSTMMNAELCLLVLVEGPPSNSANQVEQAGEQIASDLVYRLYSSIDRRLFRMGVDPEEAADLAVEDFCTEILPVSASRGDTGDEILEQDLQSVRQARLDVLLQLRSRPLAGKALFAARCGVWSFQLGETVRHAGRPAGVQEVLDGAPTTVAGISVSGAQEGADQVHRAHLRTYRFSASRNRKLLHRKTIGLLRNKLQELAESRLGIARVESVGSPGISESPGPDRTPGSLETAVSLARVAAWTLRRLAERGSWEGGWFIACRRSADVDERSVLLPSEMEFEQLQPPADRFWADPFPVLRNGRYFLFLEEYLFSTKLGRIAVTELGTDGEWSYPRPVLECDYHLSYPHLFEWNGSHYMVPETMGAGRVELYRSVEFPLKWRREAVLLEDIEAVDPTIVQVGDLWWMFVGTAHGRTSDPSDFSEQLRLYHAEDPTGPWTPHRKNPIKWDVRSSRPAGRLFRAGGELYRPAQDCSERYGHSVRIQRVVRLDTDEYHEEDAGVIGPDWSAGLIGTHTVNAVPGLLVVDGRKSYFGTRRAIRSAARHAASRSARPLFR